MIAFLDENAMDSATFYIRGTPLTWKTTKTVTTFLQGYSKLRAAMSQNLSEFKQWKLPPDQVEHQNNRSKHKQTIQITQQIKRRYGWTTLKKFDTDCNNYYYNPSFFKVIHPYPFLICCVICKFETDCNNYYYNPSFFKVVHPYLLLICCVICIICLCFEQLFWWIVIIIITIRFKLQLL